MSQNYLKTSILAVVLILSATTILAQSAPNITFTVKDSISGEPIDYATVELLNAADSSLIGGITDDKGIIAIPAQPNTAKFRVSFIGYKTKIEPVTSLNMSVLLVQDATLLSEVLVTGSNKTVKIDRDVYVITKDLKAGTATSRELLGRLNGVTYNPYDQSLMVNGSSSVLILMDGIEKDQNMAKTISPDRIDRIEVIKDPIGKYAAEGYKAVINIITKKDFQGFDVSANFNPMFNFFTPRGNKNFIQENAGVNILYTYKKLNLYATYYNWHSDLRIPLSSEKRYGDLTVFSPMDYKNPNTSALGNGNNVTLGGDYTIKEGHNIAFEMNDNVFFNDQTTYSDLTTYQNENIIGESKSKTFSHSKNNSLQGTLTYNGKWSEKSKFETDFRYRHSTPNNKSTFEQGEMFSESKNNQVENFYRINAQYSYQFNPKLSIDAGYGAILDHTNLYQSGTTLTQNQVRHRPSVYFNYAPSPKLNFKVGAMVETFNQKFTSPALTSELKQSEVGFLPLVSMMYRPSDNFSINPRYWATPYYPDINSMNTFQTQMDSLTWSLGNPYLKASNYQVIAVKFNFFKYFSIEPYFDWDNKNSQSYLYFDNSENKYFQTNVNAKLRKLGANVSFTLPITKTLFWQNDWQAFNYWISYNDNGNDVKNSQFGYYISSQLICQIPKWDAMAGIMLQKFITKNGTLQGYNQWGNDIPGIMLQKNFFKQKLSLMLLYVPPIVNDGFLQSTQGNLTEIPNVYYAKQAAGLKLLNNLILFQVNFHFNRGKQVNLTKTTLDSDTKIQQKSGGIGL